MIAFAFANPAILAALVALPAIWWLLRLTPPRPKTEVFPPLRILARVMKREETPARSPWWLTALRMALAATLILAIADPVLNPRTNSLDTGGPLILVVDNGWATSMDWQQRVETAKALIDDAENADLPVSITFTADPSHDAVPVNALTALERLAAARPRPIAPDRAHAASAIDEALNGTEPGTLAVLSDGIAGPADQEAFDVLLALSPAQIRLIEGEGENALAITSATNSPNSMSVTATRLPQQSQQAVRIDALDIQGRALASGTIEFGPGAGTATAEISSPFELRNDFARLQLDGLSTAGAVHLLDDGFKRRRVALLAGDGGSDYQPLLQPLYYISRALQPYADLIEPNTADLSVSIPQLLQSNPSAIIMADIGRLPAETYEPLQRWISRGGTLIRFAGPRLAAAPADDPLVPVILRQGERALGGALSWSEPQSLANFPDTGPFAGMPHASDITISRQVLAEPTPDLSERTWASLADGTPLVTTRQQDAGRIVLFHTSAEATWSNMPLSGTFVEMLRRLVQMARASGALSTDSASEASAAALPPYRLLNADGVLTTDIGSAKPVTVDSGGTAVSSFDHPPGLYGSEDGFSAVNLLAPEAELLPFNPALAGQPVERQTLIGNEATSLRPMLFAAAFFLILLDSLIVLFMNGAFSRLPRVRRRSAIGLAMLAAALFPIAPDSARAQDDARAGDAVAIERLDTTRLAYVMTGEAEVDRLSKQGLQGLSDFLTYRTTLEPGAPVGLDIENDELAFFPIIYWPVSASADMPSATAISRIDAYMRSGGTVLFDTRDQYSGFDGSGSITANGERLQAILANIDIPPLEPTPENHVLARSFYLLDDFPGRYSGSPLWVEARQEAVQTGSELSSSGDGVTPILITANDFAGAWAIDVQGAAVLPTVPQNGMQREYAYRAGVNIMMYMLTGNYKADQVHVPALLERLGQ